MHRRVVYKERVQHMHSMRTYKELRIEINPIVMKKHASILLYLTRILM